jgi:hypothetical protein
MIAWWASTLLFNSIFIWISALYLSFFYVESARSDFRILIFVPDQVKRDHDFFRNGCYDMMEINGVLMSASLKTA